MGVNGTAAGGAGASGTAASGAPSGGAATGGGVSTGVSGGGATAGGVSGGGVSGGTATGAGMSGGGAAASGAPSGGAGTGGAAAGQPTTGGAGASAGGGSGAGGGGQPGGGAAGMNEGGNAGSVATGGEPNGGAGGSGGTLDGGKENNGESCAVENAPTFDQATENAMFPDPFKLLSGSRITTKADWNCLRADLSAIVQACIYGPKMPPPDSLTASFSGGMLSVNMSVGGNNENFSVSISGGGSAASPAPCLITCGGSSLGGLPGSVATINMQNNSFGSEQGVGGIVRNLYGNASQDSGALICWAWGLSRIIDALEQVPEAGIDTTRIAVTGCSRNGKGALAMGAFDERVALTIPQEGGSGGPASWRVAKVEHDMGQNIQEAGEIIGEADWTGAVFRQYAQGGQNVNKLPGDQHMTIALCAPRAVLVIENNIDWLGPVATYGGGKGAMKVYEALGIADRIGVSVSADHAHCSFPQSQRAYLNAFANRFLHGMGDDTSGVDELNTTGTTSKLGQFDEAQFIDWDVPTLSGNLAWDPFA